MTGPVPPDGSRPGTGPGDDPAPRAPRWVQVLGVLVAVLVLAAVALTVLGGGGHGPSRHGSDQVQYRMDGDTGARDPARSGPA